MIRLQRVGRKNDPSFRVVVVDSREEAKTGKVIEIVGSHDARVDRTELKAERINHWLSMGAKTSNTVNNLLIKKGAITGVKVDVSSKKLGKKAKAQKAKGAKVEKAPTPADLPAGEAGATAGKPVEEIKEETPVEETKEEALT